MVQYQGSAPPLPVKQKWIGETCFKWFHAMATEEELVLLNRGPAGDRGDLRKAVRTIETMVVAKLRDLFESATPQIKLRDLFESATPPIQLRDLFKSANPPIKLRDLF
jgi:hypothetical protein